jgi:predicted ABC-type sugar transport system permease subunit
MNTIINTIEDAVVSLIYTIRELITPIFDKYMSYLKYADYIIYGTYAILLLGFYTTLPEYIPRLRNFLLYSAVVILLLRFNTISWNNPKFAILGGSKFSEIDRRLIMYMCIFIMITHIVSETVIQYTQKQIADRIIQPVSSVSKEVIHPVYNYIVDGVRGGK